MGKCFSSTSCPFKDVKNGYLLMPNRTTKHMGWLGRKSVRKCPEIWETVKSLDDCMKAAKEFNVTLFDNSLYVEEFQSSCYWTKSPSQVHLDSDYLKHASARSFCTNKSPFKLLLAQLVFFILLPCLIFWALKSFFNSKKELKKKRKEIEKKKQQLENNDEKGLSILEEGKLETKECNKQINKLRLELCTE